MYDTAISTIRGCGRSMMVSSSDSVNDFDKFIHCTWCGAENPQIVKGLSSEGSMLINVMFFVSTQMTRQTRNWF